VRAAGAAAEALPHRLILLGAPAVNPEDEYGWILPGGPLGLVDGRPITSVRSFLEKPAAALARAAQRAGAVWNTFVMVAKAQSLWDLASAHQGDLARRFTHLRAAIGRPDEQAVLEELYRTMPSRNFCSDVLEHAADRTALLTLDGLVWSDWGRPERIIDTLTALGRQPSFSTPGMVMGQPRARHAMMDDTLRKTGT